MSTQDETEVRTKFTISDMASKALSGIAASASRASNLFNSLSSSVGHFAGIAGLAAGAFSFGEALQDTTELIGRVKRINTLTGEAPEKISAWVDVLETAGMEAGSIERTLMSMSKRATMLGEGGSGGGAGKMFKAIGIDMKKGPEASFLKMADLAQKGKLQVSQLQIALRMSGQEASTFVGILKKGPQYLKDGFAAAGEFGAVVDSQTLSTFAELKQAQRDIKDAWSDIRLIITKETLPVILDLTRMVKEKLESWLPAAQQFGQFLKGHMTDALNIATKTGKVLMANFLLQKFTGQGIGGVGGKLLGGAFSGGLIAPRAERGIGASLRMLLGQAMVGGATGLQSLGGGIKGAGSSLLSGITSPLQTFSSLIQGLMRLRPLVSGLLKLGIIAVFVEAAREGFGAVMNNFMGIRDFMMEIWEKLKATFQSLKLTFSPIADLFTEGGVIGTFFKLALPMAISGLLMVVQKIIEFVQKIAEFISEIMNNKMDSLRHPMEAWARASKRVEDRIQNQIDLNKRAAKGEFGPAKSLAPQVPSQREKQPYYDFRNSKFDITQKFDDNDPDRIAVGFAGSLSSMADRRLSSGLTPLYSPT